MHGHNHLCVPHSQEQQVAGTGVGMWAADHCLTESGACTTSAQIVFISFHFWSPALTPHCKAAQNGSCARWYGPSATEATRGTHKLPPTLTPALLSTQPPSLTWTSPKPLNFLSYLPQPPLLTAKGVIPSIYDYHLQ